MADQRLTDKTALTVVAQDDLVHVVDVSDTTANAEGTSKKVTIANLKTAVEGSGVQSVTGDIVDNTDPLNPNVDTPTIQQVLTAGNEISAGTELVFRGAFGGIAHFSKLLGALTLEVDDFFFITKTGFIGQLEFDVSSFGFFSSIDYTNYTTGVPSGDRKIYAQRGYVDDTKNLITGYTVATLPTGTTGQIAHVTDATAVTYRGTATGGGANIALVMFDGTNWIYH